MTKLKLIKSLDEVDFYNDCDKLYEYACEQGKNYYLDKYLSTVYPKGVDFNDLTNFMESNFDTIYEILDLDEISGSYIENLEPKLDENNNVKIFVEICEYTPAGLAERIVTLVCGENKLEDLYYFLAKKFPEGATEEELDDYIVENCDEILEELKLGNKKIRYYNDLAEELERNKSFDKELHREIHELQSRQAKAFIKRKVSSEQLRYYDFDYLLNRILDKNAESFAELGSGLTKSGKKEVLKFV